MDAATLAELVGKAKCRVFGWEDAANEPQRNVLAVLPEGFDHTDATILCEPSLARKTTRPPDALLIDPIAGVHLIEVKGYALDQIEAIEPGGLLKVGDHGDRIRRARSPKSARRCLTSRMPPRKPLHPTSRCTSSTGSSSRQLAGNLGLGDGAQMPMHLQHSCSRTICLNSPTRSGQMGNAILQTRVFPNGPPISLPASGEPSAIHPCSIKYRRNGSHVVFPLLRLANFSTRLPRLTRPSPMSSNVVTRQGTSIMALLLLGVCRPVRHPGGPVLLEEWWGGSVSLSELSTAPSHLSPAVHPETVSMRARGSRAIRREPQDTRRSDERAGGVESRTRPQTQREARSFHGREQSGQIGSAQPHATPGIDLEIESVRQVLEQAEPHAVGDPRLCFEQSLAARDQQGADIEDGRQRDQPGLTQCCAR